MSLVKLTPGNFLIQNSQILEEKEATFSALCLGKEFAFVDPKALKKFLISMYVNHGVFVARGRLTPPTTFRFKNYTPDELFDTTLINDQCAFVFESLILAGLKQKVQTNYSMILLLQAQRLQLYRLFGHDHSFSFNGVFPNFTDLLVSVTNPPVNIFFHFQNYLWNMYSRKLLIFYDKIVEVPPALHQRSFNNDWKPYFEYNYVKLPGNIYTMVLSVFARTFKLLNSNRLSAASTTSLYDFLIFFPEIDLLPVQKIVNSVPLGAKFLTDTIYTKMLFGYRAYMQGRDSEPNVSNSETTVTTDTTLLVDHEELTHFEDSLDLDLSKLEQRFQANNLFVN